MSIAVDWHNGRSLSCAFPCQKAATGYVKMGIGTSVQTKGRRVQLSTCTTGTVVPLCRSAPYPGRSLYSRPARIGWSTRFALGGAPPSSRGRCFSLPVISPTAHAVGRWDGSASGSVWSRSPSPGLAARFDSFRLRLRAARRTSSSSVPVPRGAQSRRLPRPGSPAVRSRADRSTLCCVARSPLLRRRSCVFLTHPVQLPGFAVGPVPLRPDHRRRRRYPTGERPWPLYPLAPRCSGRRSAVDLDLQIRPHYAIRRQGHGRSIGGVLVLRPRLHDAALSGPIGLLAGVRVRRPHFRPSFLVCAFPLAGRSSSSSASSGGCRFGSRRQHRALEALIAGARTSCRRPLRGPVRR